MEMSLREYLCKRGKLDEVEALSLGLQIAKGLLYLKSRGILAHQDLKPENVLLEDLNKTHGYGLPHPLNLRVRLCDFGLANAWVEAGIPGGTNPYKAPEQFVPRIPKTINEELFKPDIFALGIILTEMSTGFHPSGLKSEDIEKKARDARYWEEWAINGERVVSIRSTELKRLVHQMLDPNPLKRPSLEEVYRKLMSILKNRAKETYKQLMLMLEWYDTLASYYMETGSWIEDLLKVFRVATPKERSHIMETLQYERSKIDNIKSPNEAVYKCKLDYAIGRVLLIEGKSRNKDKIILLAREIIDVLAQWRDGIKVEHLYPPLTFRGECISKQERLRNYEVHAELLKYGLILLMNVLNENEIRDIMDKYDNYMKSLYHYYQASLQHYLYGSSELDKFIGELNKAIHLTPDNPVPRYFKSLWIKQWVDEIMALNKEGIDKDLVCSRLQEALNEINHVIKIDKEWIEPIELLEELKSAYEKLCLKGLANEER